MRVNLNLLQPQAIIFVLLFVFSHLCKMPFFLQFLKRLKTKVLDTVRCTAQLMALLKPLNLLYSYHEALI